MNNHPKAGNVANRVTTVLFIIYLVAICWILLFKLGVHFSYMAKRSVNVVPFNRSFILTSENILNVVVFVPLGIYAGVLFQKWILAKKLLFVFLLSLVFEGLQYILRVGAFDVDDIITNTTGGVIGFIIYKAIEAVINHTRKAQRFINIIAATGTVLMLLLLVLLRMNMLPIRYQ